MVAGGLPRILEIHDGNGDENFNDCVAFARLMAAAQETGLYASEGELITDALRTFLAARPDVRLATACRLYERGTVSLGNRRAGRR
jgi:hypothetical protein